MEPAATRAPFPGLLPVAPSAVLALLLVMLLAACTPAARPGNAPPAPGAGLVWPAPPAPARLEYVRSFSRLEDFGLRRPWYRRLADWITGRDTLHFVRPTDVLRTAAGIYYVADPGSRGVHRLDPDQARHRLIRRRGGRPLPSPVGLAADVRGRVYVTDSALGQVYVIEPGSRYAEAWPTEEPLQRPTGIALGHGDGRVYVCDTLAHRVRIFDREGRLLRDLGRRGEGEGEFNFPTMIRLDPEGRLLVADSLNFRIQIFAPDGSFLGSFGHHGDATGDMARPKGVAADADGHIYVVDSIFHAVQVFDERGTFLLNVGSQGRGPGEFWLPTGIFITAGGEVYVADSHNHRVQVLRYLGGRP